MRGDGWSRWGEMGGADERKGGALAARGDLAVMY